MSGNPHSSGREVRSRSHCERALFASSPISNFLSCFGSTAAQILSNKESDAEQALQKRMTLTTRPPVVPQPASCDVSANPKHRVLILHPGYTEAQATLLSLAAFDRAAGGLHFDTARIACGIIAGNRWDGFFTKDAEGKELAVSDTEEGILPVGDYYFHLPDFSDKRYPIVPTFHHWDFPHDNLPPSWTATTLDSSSSRPPLFSRSDSSIALYVRDEGACRMSLHTEACEKAHLCPVSENEWFSAQLMHKYAEDSRSTGETAIYDVNNMVLLRADLHKSFDDRKFVFIPKARQFVVHMLCPSRELTAFYHNSRLHPLDSVPREYLFTRLAWALFPLLEGFLQANKDRLIISASCRGQPYVATAKECRLMTSSGKARSRNNSPTKRTRSNAQDVEPDNQERSLLAAEGLEEISMTKRRRPSDSCTKENWQGCRHSVHAGRRESSSKCTSLRLPDVCRSKRPRTTDRQCSATAVPLSPQSLPHVASTPPAFTLDLPRSSHAVQPDLGSLGTLTSPFAPQSESLTDAPPTVSESVRLNELRQTALEQERKRSDKDGAWEKELAWARQYLMETSAEEEDMRRLWDILGRRSVDDH
ncbi:MAG: hypothetical protein Q9225_007096 [Loekoesia sp. 1 TL-2023]